MTLANDHPDDLAPSLLLRSFANGHLQRGRFSGWPKGRGRRSRNCCKWSSGWSGLLRSFANGHLQTGLSSKWPTFFSSNRPTVQELGQSDRWILTMKCNGNYALPVRWKISRVIEFLPQLSQSSLHWTGKTKIRIQIRDLHCLLGLA